ncbi:TKL protein kinase [Saprolegnia diclina VS20]|uniref:TKL protein kinase n=1 Tax=Saprolegnia diclina (strain VS20) TaxID=1156394 RepID=T0RMZ3_SAPDV|nr:TKL protein kinase [Saprolegnia diclina VS20]EQC31332.1 TKL protein kinase [Saprolegnia diclina VS20]|eukprot:XP_008615173.1 TKL protein kinase [Saprolegnia diclina VS20]
MVTLGVVLLSATAAMAAIGIVERPTLRTVCLDGACVQYPNGTLFPVANSTEWDVVVNCSLPFTDIEALPANATSVVLDNVGLERLPHDLRVDSAGRAVLAQRLAFPNNALTSLDHVHLPAGTTHWDVHDNVIATLGDLSMNTNLAHLDVSGNSISSLDAVKLPPSLQYLSLARNRLSSLGDIALPATLRTLNLSGNRIATLGGIVLPQHLEDLDLSFNKLGNVSQLVWPSQLRRLSLANNDLRDMAAAFPPSLTSLCLCGNPSLVLYTSASQLEHLASLFDGNCSQDDARRNVTCRGGHAPARVLHTIPLCLVESAAADVITLTGALQPTEGTTSSASLLPVAWVALAVVSVLLAIAIAGCCCYRRRYQLAKRSKQVWFCEDQPSSVLMLESRPTVGYGLLANDIRFEARFQSCFVPPNTIVRDRVIARGGFGIVYLATIYPSQKHRMPPLRVAMKRVLPQFADDLGRIEDFMLEIDLGARLCHPKIVTFVGITWTTLYNISSLTEYMPNGDVWSLLERSKSEIVLPWNVLSAAALPMPSDEKALPRLTVSDVTELSIFTEYDPCCPVSKVSILADMADALAYLHCLHPTIVHRDVKTKNVLLDANWVAKLADFGASRSYGDSDLVMTAEIGTVPWIAPEVLKGVRYSEKADIYSFGVAMSEVDLCIVPYSNVAMCSPDSQVSLTMAKSRVAVLVTTGQLRPSFSHTCPPAILDIARRCLAYYPEDRPSAAELRAWFQRLKPASSTAA